MAVHTFPRIDPFTAEAENMPVTADIPDALTTIASGDDLPPFVGAIAANMRNIVIERDDLRRELERVLGLLSELQRLSAAALATRERDR